MRTSPNQLVLLAGMSSEMCEENGKILCRGRNGTSEVPLGRVCDESTTDLVSRTLPMASTCLSATLLLHQRRFEPRVSHQQITTHLPIQTTRSDTLRRLPHLCQLMYPLQHGLYMVLAHERPRRRLPYTPSANSCPPASNGAYQYPAFLLLGRRRRFGRRLRWRPRSSLPVLQVRARRDVAAVVRLRRVRVGGLVSEFGAGFVGGGVGGGV